MGDGDPFPRSGTSDVKSVDNIANTGILPEFDIKFSFPDVIFVNRMPPLPDKLSVKATATISVKNNSGKREVLSAPTVCDVHHWDLMEESGKLIESEKDGMCLTVHQTRILEPNETIRSDYLVSMNGKLLEENKKYKLRFKFWYFEAEALFVAKHRE